MVQGGAAEPGGHPQPDRVHAQRRCAAPHPDRVLPCGDQPEHLAAPGRRQVDAAGDLVAGRIHPQQGALLQQHPHRTLANRDGGRVAGQHNARVDDEPGG